MRFRSAVLLCVWSAVCLPLSALSIDRYVSLTGSNTPPFTSWATAATNIQTAIDASTAGDVVWVTNGTYETGGRVAPGSATTNRVVIDKAITVRSVNGFPFTTIRGAFHPGGTNGNAAVRCVWMTNNAVLANFTLTNGATKASDYGGGVWCQSTAAYISNCMIVGNSADAEGGGVLLGSLQFCTLAGNSAPLGGGASGSMLTLCNLTSNRAAVGGGALLGTLALCQLFGNQATNFGGGVSGGTLTNCTLLGNMSGNQGGGAYAATVNNSILLQNSAPYGGGSARGTLNQCNVLSNTASLAGGGAYTSTLNRCRVTFNSADNFGGGASQSTLNNCLLYANFSGSLGGGAMDSILNNCSVLRNGASLNAGGVRSCRVVNSIVYFNQSGLIPYEYDLSSFTNSCTTPLPPGAGNIDADPQFVFASGGHARLLPTSPCLNVGTNELSTGALDLDGNVRTNGAVVDMGAYELGYHYVARSNATPVAPYLTWGTAATSIQDAVDAAYVGSAILVSNGVYDTGGRAQVGQSVTNRVFLHKPVVVQSVNGARFTSIQGQGPIGESGVRGVWMTNQAALIGFTITNGATGDLASPEADQLGGGIYAVSSNAVISRCIIRGNSAIGAGGLYGGTADSCLLAGNVANMSGGGALSANLIHCSVVDNSAYSGGGIDECTVKNGIVYFNQATEGSNYYFGAFEASCSSPLPPGVGNSAAAPVFRNRSRGDYRLSPFSPHIDVLGSSLVVGTADLDGNPRRDFTHGDLGAYELHSTYASANNPSAAYPYNSFSTAASNIQDAIDAAYVGGAVTVYSGTYDQGGRPAPGSLLTNRIIIDKPLYVVGIGVPSKPIIKGAGPVGDAAVRCAWMTNETYLENFVLTNGATRGAGDLSTEQSGAGVWAPSAGAIVENCLLTDNAAESDGGGASGGRLANCLLTRNSAAFGGGASYYFSPGGMVNCTVVSNTAVDSGGVYAQDHVNCIVQFNSASSHPNHDAATFSHSCLSPNPGGAGNFDADPLFRHASNVDYRVSYSSPCVNAGDSSRARGLVAYNGTPRISGEAVDIGAHEVGELYVDVNNSTPYPPFFSWGTAATTIQDAVSYSLDGEIVNVADGVYETGGAPAPLTSLTNRVTILKPILVKSVNGPTWTTIRGQGPIGDNASRCVYLAGGATLEGFTLTNGATRASGDVTTEQCGGGVYGLLDGNGASVVTRCIIANNSAEAEGGGVSGGLVQNSLLKGNGAFYGGGASFNYAPGFLNNCTVVGNSSFGAGGGVKGGVTLNSIVYNNFGTGNPNYDNVFFAYSCTTPDPAGDHCITNNPKFENAAAGNYRLNFTSPCIEAGYNFEAALPTDLDGNVRILDTVVEMGAYEYTGNVVDSDGDGYVDHEELVAGTNPSDTSSYFRVLSTVLSSGVPAFTFNSVSGRIYSLETRDQLLAPPDWTPTFVYTSAVDAVLTALTGSATTRFSRITVRLP